jgi:hypothetical protein
MPSLHTPHRARPNLLRAGRKYIGGHAAGPRAEWGEREEDREKSVNRAKEAQLTCVGRAQ